MTDEKPTKKPKITSEQLLAEISKMFQAHKDLIDNRILEMDKRVKDIETTKTTFPQVPITQEMKPLDDVFIDNNSYFKHFQIPQERQNAFMQNLKKLMTEYGVYHVTASLVKKF